MRNRAFKCLAMRDIEKQTLRRGGINAAYAQVAADAVLDVACRLLPRAIDQFLDRGIENGTLPGLDSVSPQRLAEELHAQLTAVPSCSDPGLTPEDQDIRLATFLNLRAGVTTDLAREIIAKAAALVNEPMGRLREALLTAYANAPGEIGKAVASLPTGLERLCVPDVTWKPLIRWQELKRLGDKLRQRRNMLPASTTRTIQEALTSEIRRQYDQVVRAIATERVVAAWQSAKGDVIEFLDTLAKRAGEVIHELGAVKNSLEDIRKAVAADQRISRASVVKNVPGPTEDQVIAGMLGHLHVTEENALARTLLDRFENQLREVCQQVCAWIASDESFSELVRGIPPEIQASAFRTVVEKAQGTGLSFYELLQKEGIDECVDFLFRRSEPTVNLAGRDMARLGISPARLCIVTLPQAVGPKDFQIREEFRTAFEKIEPTCAFSDAPTSARTITVVRVCVAWPIGIEGQNHNLLGYYQHCADYGHRPHLFGIIPDSPDGQVIDGYKNLVSFTTYTTQENNHAEENHAQDGLS